MLFEVVAGVAPTGSTTAVFCSTTAYHFKKKNCLKSSMWSLSTCRLPCIYDSLNSQGKLLRQFPT